MRRKVLTVYLATLVVFIAGFWAGTRFTPNPAQAQTPTYLSAVPISSTLTTTQIWMSEPFCVRAWWGPTLCSEVKGTGDHPDGAPYKLDFLPAWLALEGRDAQGRWTLHSIAKTNDQSPGANFVAVIGPTLVTVLSQVTPSPTTPPPASVTPSPPFEATDTPTARAATPTPPSPPGGGVPTLSPAQLHGFRVVCDDTGSDYALDIWGYYDLVYRVPSEWCAPSYTGLQHLLERMASATPSKVTVHP